MREHTFGKSLFTLLWTVELAGRNLPDGLRVHYKCICPSMSEHRGLRDDILHVRTPGKAKVMIAFVGTQLDCSQFRFPSVIRIVTLDPNGDDPYWIS